MAAEEKQNELKHWQAVIKIIDGKWRFIRAGAKLKDGNLSNIFISPEAMKDIQNWGL